MSGRHRAAIALAAGAAGLAVAGGVAAGVGADAPGQRATALSARDLPGIPAADRAIVLASSDWLRLTRRPVVSLRALGDAHPGTKTIRVNRTRAQITGRTGRQRFPYPRRTVIVKTARIGGTVTVVAIVRKIAAGGDISSWRFVEYTRPSSGGAFGKVGGGQATCTGCHTVAITTQSSDGVFTRLR